jgi:hypothetical protein
VDAYLSRFSCGEGEVQRMLGLCKRNVQLTLDHRKNLGSGFREFALYMEPNCYAADVLGSRLPTAVKVFFVFLLFGNRNGRDMMEKLEGYIEPNQLDRILSEVTANPPQLVAGKDSALCTEMARRMGNPPPEYGSTYGQLGFIFYASERFPKDFPILDLAANLDPRGVDAGIRSFFNGWRAKAFNGIGIQ